MRAFTAELGVRQPPISLNQDLGATHREVVPLIGAGAEPLDILHAVEAHRQYWRPDRVRVVLFAESHVYTTASELAHRLRPLAELPTGLPREFVRLVYNVGYGENQLLEQPIAAPRNSGTPQYWKIFQSCLTPAGTVPDCAPLQPSRTSDARSRLRAKLRLLMNLKSNGVWLVDASVAALYVPGQSKPAPNVRQAVLEASWHGYIGAMLRAAAPEAILCIGVGVARSLKRQLDQLAIPWAGVHQPQAHLSSEEHARIHATYGAVCADPRYVESIPSVV
ncbi:MAG: hypothetical protein ABI035_10585 [Gemmatimonadaceae bacterium]